MQGGTEVKEATTSREGHIHHTCHIVSPSLVPELET
jgi:hypothetical protein